MSSLAHRPRVLIANRGEIALRLVRAAREAGLTALAVAVPEEVDLPYAQAADELFVFEERPGHEPFLDTAAILAVAKRARADLVHPGYGFLAETPRLAEAVRAAGMKFVGPSVAALETAGDKTLARRAAASAGVPCLPGAAVAAEADRDELKAAAAGVGYPLLVKATAGGGGRGIRVVRDESLLSDAVDASRREANAAFGDGRFYFERAVEAPRHVEVQLLADDAGSIALFPERDCSVQRRHQKLIEESPSPRVDDALCGKLQEAAARVARALGYTSAGTVEFLLGTDGQAAQGLFHFIEINARLQVEHPVTEELCAVDLAAWQMLLALGESLAPHLVGAVSGAGHAIECRLIAETPPRFLPSTGTLLAFRPPCGPGIRFDTGYREGNRVTTRYDSLLGKLIAHGPDRAAALRRAAEALRNCVVLGVDSNLSYLAAVLDHPRFSEGLADTEFVAAAMTEWTPATPPDEAQQIAAALFKLPLGKPAEPAAGSAGPWSVRGGPWAIAGVEAIEVRT